LPTNNCTGGMNSPGLKQQSFGWWNVLLSKLCILKSIMSSMEKNECLDGMIKKQITETLWKERNLWGIFRSLSLHIRIWWRTVSTHMSRFVKLIRWFHLVIYYRNYIDRVTHGHKFRLSELYASEQPLIQINHERCICVYQSWCGNIFIRVEKI
jgi:hypothetical protein